MPPSSWRRSASSQEADSPPDTAEATISVLIVSDDELLVGSCREILSTAKAYTVFSQKRGRRALAALRHHRPDIVLTDLELSDPDGAALVKKTREIAPRTLVVVVTTSVATVDGSVEAIRAGADDCISKPFTTQQLSSVMLRAARQVQLERDRVHLRDQLKKRYSFEAIVGTSDAIRRVVSIMSRVAPTDVSVFISGEPGTETGLIARVIHANSRRSDGPFVGIGCARLPQHLLEGELFGYETQFTGRDMRGLLEVASGGTLFLEEITEISMDLQARLLRIIDGQCTRRIHGTRDIPLDMRWISSSSRDVEQAVRQGQLRQDLLDRINGVPVIVPGLQQRREDIPALSENYLQAHSARFDRSGVRFSPDALRVLARYPWPGNMLELQKTIEQIAWLSVDEREITPADLPDHFGRSPEEPLAT